MADIRNWTNEAWCIMGVLNAVRSKNERNRERRDPRNRRLLNDFIAEMELVNYPLNGGDYTWNDKQDNPLLCRLDRTLVCTSFDTAYRSAIQTALVRAISDHSPIMLDLNPEIKTNSYFKVEHHWFQHKDFLKRVEEWWSAMTFSGTPSFVFFRKLQNLKLFSKGWSREIKGFTDGNKNTRYFHSIANAERKMSCITKIEVNGVDIFNQEVIKNKIHQYYTHLFTASSSSSSSSFSPSFENMEFRKIDNDEAAWLENHFTEEEVHKAIKMCGANKAPWSDGFTMDFYRIGWDIIKHNLMLALNEFYTKAERMKIVMPKLVSNAKGAFIKDKQILDGILIANECIDSRLKQRLPDMVLVRGGLNGFIGVTGAQFSVLVNGNATNMIKPTKGIRQGDPLSPFLFLLVVEVLSLLINNVVAYQKINDFTVKEGGGQWCLTLLTGLKLILYKSAMTSIGVDEVINELIRSWDLPVSVEKKINTIMRTFLWGEDDENKKMSWVGWDKVSKPKNKGGLGIRNLRCVNRYLLAKWHWRYANEKEAWWRKLMCEKTNQMMFFFFLWRLRVLLVEVCGMVLKKSKTKFYSYADIQLKNGAGCRFWHDWWLEKKALSEKYPRLYKLSLNKNGFVSKFIGINWSLSFKRTLDAAERIDLLEIKYDMRNITLRGDAEDDVVGDF
ncbi:uncharacterized protein LOC113278713 [Papaver somniferum]|uniref:uncharacterized protein LOC113278713 n=1 Tax=Papaver somniferum TaxID=3469 RepID=UPI000E6FB61C|nr:uncharacterized protein LOC113278713 [Papaver somniferum]